MAMPYDLEWSNLDNLAVATAKALAADAIEKAGSGHPGSAISLAGPAYLLYQRLMRHDPANPKWLGRDRLVLSAGHTVALLYVQLFLAGYDVSLEDIQALRTAGSITPGHPEHGLTPGVEMSTGPLGQGLASAVGMAMAARRLGAMLEPGSDGRQPLDHTIWVIAGEGDLEEGITAEASSMAGTHKLANLVVLYDENQISIEGSTDLAFTEDVLARYRAYGWHTDRVDWTHGGRYAEDYQALYQALKKAQAVSDAPSIVCLRSIIGWPSPTKQNTASIHGAKLGPQEVAGLKRNLGLDPASDFAVPPEVLQHTRRALGRGAKAAAAWDQELASWLAPRPDAAALLERLRSGLLPEGWRDSLPSFAPGKPIATRAASGKVLAGIGPVLPELWGGSADLAGSNNTTIEGETSFLPANPTGRTIHFGVREHAMGAILNGIALDGLTVPYGGTFLVFSDYMRGAMRLSALMQLPVTYVLTHDSLGVGEDGPTHQPIEHLESLRAIPGMAVIRPADADETVQAWAHILESSQPVCLVLSRQNLPVPDRAAQSLASAENLRFGAYVLAASPLAATDVILLASGSEVQLALQARELLGEEGIGARVVSAPCLEWFDQQSDSYRQQVLPSKVRARVSVEAGTPGPWRGLVGTAGQCVAVTEFGASAPGADLLVERGFTAANVVNAAHRSLELAGL